MSVCVIAGQSDLVSAHINKKLLKISIGHASGFLWGPTERLSCCIRVCVCVWLCQCGGSTTACRNDYESFSVAYAYRLQFAYLVIQTGNEKTSLSTDTAVMFYSWVVLQVMTALCCSFVYHGKRGTEAKQRSPFLSQLPFEPHTVCICRFDLLVGMTMLSNTGLCPEHTAQSDQREAERGEQSAQATLSVFGQGLVRALRTEGGGEDWSSANLGEKNKALFH